MDDDERVGAVRALAHFARFLERACDDTSLTLSQYRLLSYVEDSEHRAGELAQRASVSRPALTVAIDGLVERRLVTRERLADDRRAIRVRLTARGRRALAEVDRALWTLVARVVPEEQVAGVVDAAMAIGQGMARSAEAERSEQPDGRSRRTV